MFKKIKWYDWLIISGISIMTLFNPLIGQYIIKGIINSYELLSVTHADMVISSSLTLIITGFIGSKINIKKNYNAKLKKLTTNSKSKYIET